MAESLASFEKCRAYIVSQLEKDDRAKGAKPHGARPAITLSRATGAGALVLADHLAGYLNERDPAAENRWTVFDKDLVKRVLEDHDLPARLEAAMPEDRPGAMDDTLGTLLGLHPPSWKLLQHTAETIYRLAVMGNCILVGRGANVITEGLPNVLRLRLVASLESRTKTHMRIHKVGQAEARDTIKKEDRARRRYMLAHHDRDIDDPQNYHMVVNLDAFSHEDFVKTVGNMVLNWGNQE